MNLRLFYLVENLKQNNQINTDATYFCPAYILRYATV